MKKFSFVFVPQGAPSTGLVQVQIKTRIERRAGTQLRINSIVFTFSSGKSHWGHAGTSVMFLGALKNFHRAARELCKNKKIFSANILLAERLEAIGAKPENGWLWLLNPKSIRVNIPLEQAFRACNAAPCTSRTATKQHKKCCSYNVNATQPEARDDTKNSALLHVSWIFMLRSRSTKQ